MSRGGNDEYTMDGGFLTGNDIDSPAQAKGKEGNTRKEQSVTPVAIRQLRECEGDVFKLFGMPVQIVVIVGILREYEVQSTKATYEIEDHTGKITAMWFLENEMNNEPNLPEVKEGRYCQVFGLIRVYEGRKTIMILKMFQVDNINIITNHLLQVIHVRLEAEAMSKEGGTIAKIRAQNPGAGLASMMGDETTSSSVNGITPLQQQIINILKPIDTPNGLSRKQIMQHFPGHRHNDVSHALDFMVNEGHAYSTIDTEHFKATDNYAF